MEQETISDYSQATWNSTSPFNKRTIEPHGIEKYLITLERKNAEKYNDILNNRIAKLLKEDQRTKHISELAQKRADAMMQTHQRHIEEMHYKEHIRNIKKQQEEEQRLKNFIEREQRKKNIATHQENLYSQKRQAVVEIRKNGSLGHRALHEFKELIEKKRVEKVQYMKFQMEFKKKNRSKSQLHYRSQLKQEYEQRIQQEKEMFEKSISKRRELEAIESGLMQKVSESIALMSNFTQKGFDDKLNETSRSQSPEKSEISN